MGIAGEIGYAVFWLVVGAVITFGIMEPQMGGTETHPITALTPTATELAAEMRVLGRQEGFNIGYTVAATEFGMIMGGMNENMGQPIPGEAGRTPRGADRVGVEGTGSWSCPVPAMAGGR